MRIPRELKAWIAEEPGKRTIINWSRDCGYFLQWQIAPKTWVHGYWANGQGVGQTIGQWLLSRRAESLRRSIDESRKAAIQEAGYLRAIERKLKELEK